MREERASPAPSLRTRRLLLVPGTLDLVRAALAGPPALGAALDATVPHSWPPEFLDDDAFRYVEGRLASAPDEREWWFYFVLLPDPESRLIGSVGYKGPPSPEGSVEIGYGIVADERRRGYASEAAGGLIRRAFGHAAVQCVLAETFPDLAGSLGVLRREGFRLLGPGSEPGVLRFQLTRQEWAARQA